MDQIFTFRTDNSGVYHFHPRTGSPGIISMINDERPLFLFTGTLTEEECKKAVEALADGVTIPGIIAFCGARSGKSIPVKIDANPGPMTVFSPNESEAFGQVVISEG